LAVSSAAISAPSSVRRPSIAATSWGISLMRRGYGTSRMRPSSPAMPPPSSEGCRDRRPGGYGTLRPSCWSPNVEASRAARSCTCAGSVEPCQVGGDVPTGRHPECRNAVEPEAERTHGRADAIDVRGARRRRTASLEPEERAPPEHRAEEADSWFKFAVVASATPAASDLAGSSR
jgi:hypothetical protein